MYVYISQNMLYTFLRCLLLYNIHSVIVCRQYAKEFRESHYLEIDKYGSLYELEPDSYIGRLPFIPENFLVCGKTPYGVSLSHEEILRLMPNVFFISEDFIQKNARIKDIAQKVFTQPPVIEDIPQSRVSQSRVSQSANTIYFNDGQGDVSPSQILSRFSEKYKFEYHSQFSPIVVTVPSLEFAYQASKADNPTDEKFVLEATSSLDAKRKGNDISVRNDWIEVNLATMFSIALQHALANSDVSAYLLSTGDAILVNSGNDHRDSYWADYQGGKNMLGKVWMSVRSLLMSMIQ